MRTRWLVVSFVVLATAPPLAFAQPASVQAQSLFDEGRTLLKAGKLAEACAAFEASQKLDPAITTLLNLADCREQNHQLATAWGTFVDAGRMARASTNDKLARVATNHAHKLEPRLSRLTISVPADRQVAGLEVLRGNDPVNPASWNHALPIDGGTYTITARARGRAPWSTTRTIKVEADAQTVEIPKLAEARPGAPVAVSRAGGPGGPPTAAVAPAGSPGRAPPSATPNVGSSGGAAPAVPSARSVADATPAPAMAPVSTPVVDQPKSRHARVLPIVVGAGALVLGGTALGFDFSGNRIYDRAQASTDQARRDDLYHSANTRRYIAEGLGVAALGCAGAAVYVYVRGRGERPPDATALVPVASPELTGLAAFGRW